jgi:hypothetical protein
LFQLFLRILLALFLGFSGVPLAAPGEEDADGPCCTRRDQS